MRCGVCLGRALIDTNVVDDFGNFSNAARLKVCDALECMQTTDIKV